MKRLYVIMLCLIPAPAFAQAWVPPFCSGANRALQYASNGWQCVTITGVQGPIGPQGPAGPAGPPGPQGPAMPAAPSPQTCITAHWNGTQWNCVPTNNLTTN